MWFTLFRIVTLDLNDALIVHCLTGLAVQAMRDDRRRCNRACRSQEVRLLRATDWANASPDRPSRIYPHVDDRHANRCDKVLLGREVSDDGGTVGQTPEACFAAYEMNT